MKNKDLREKVFVFIEKYKQQEKYYLIKLHSLISEGDNEVMISIIDNSHEI